MADTILNSAGDSVPDFPTVFATLQSQIDPAKLAETDRQIIAQAHVAGNRYPALQLLLSKGANLARFGWTDVFLALAFGTLDDLEEAVTGKSDLEAIDGQNRTAFLFSIQLGDIAKTRLLIDAGANIHAVGLNGKTPLAYAIEQDNVSMLEWLLEEGFDPDLENEFGETAVFTASELGATGCLKKLIDVGADINKYRHAGSGPIDAAKNRLIVEMLLDAGLDLNSLDAEELAALLGYKFDEPPEASLDDYRKGGSRVFGRTNPERIHNPFWTAMVECGGTASLAEMKYSAEARALRKNKSSAPPEKPKKTWVDPRTVQTTDSMQGGEYPIWCYRRFGKSITRLPDGRFIEIAGEHEDWYDLNFCIYNDVIVHDGQGHCEIYAYPREVFPPTDSHSATLVDDFIYIIGNIGYKPERRPGFTPVYRLNIHSLKIEQVETKGDMPGWIHRHAARYDGQTRITISGGECTILEDGKLGFADNRHVFELDLQTLTWTRKA